MPVALVSGATLAGVAPVTVPCIILGCAVASRVRVTELTAVVPEIHERLSPAVQVRTRIGGMYSDS